jgi:non-ribosomal peptide synthetase component F
MYQGGMMSSLLIDLIFEHADLQPDHAAIVHNERSLTYSELKKNTGRLAACLLRDHHLKDEQLVGIHGTRSIESITGMLAVLLREALTFHCRQVGRKPASVRSPRMPVWKCFWMMNRRNLSGRPDAQHPLPFIFEKSSRTCSELSGVENRSTGLCVFYLRFDRQTQGVMIEQRNVMTLLRGLEKAAPEPKKFIGTALAPIGFDASVLEIYSILCFGGTLHLIDYPEKIPEMVHYFAQQHITSTYLPPLMLTDFLKALKKTGEKVELDRLLTGVEPILQKTLQAYRDEFPAAHIFNGYGPTETTICATCFMFEKAVEPERRVPSARPSTVTGSIGRRSPPAGEERGGR